MEILWLKDFIHSIGAFRCYLWVGIGGNFTITFSNGSWIYLFDNAALTDDEHKLGLFLNILKDGKKIARYTCAQMK